MHALHLHHDQQPAGLYQFTLVRATGGKRTGPITLPSPWDRNVSSFLNDRGAPQDLKSALRWLHERYICAPASPFLEAARATQQELEAWGLAAMRAICQDSDASQWLHAARGSGTWLLRIYSNAPEVLSWPWEALQLDRAPGPIGLDACVERTVYEVNDPRDLPEGLAKDRLEILLVCARPLGPNDIPYRAISGPLLEKLREGESPARITLLRPPTLEALTHLLRAKAGFFHVLHFDGHGDVQDGEGRLYFEDGQHQADPVPATKLATLLHRNPIPVVVLNACRSGDQGETGANNAVATKLLQAGVRGVVAMSHVVHRVGAERFVSAFYRTLFSTGNVSEAAREGRLQMYRDDKRPGRRGTVILDDWMIPVVYQNESHTLSFLQGAQGDGRSELGRPPLLLRDAELLFVERALLQSEPIISLMGEQGVGKTALAKELVIWLRRTGWPGRVLFLSGSALTTVRSFMDRAGLTLGQDYLCLNDTEKERRLFQDVFARQKIVVLVDDADEVAQSAGALIGRLCDRLRENVGSARLILLFRNQPAWVSGRPGSILRFAQDSSLEFAASTIPKLGGGPGVERSRRLQRHPCDVRLPTFDDPPPPHAGRSDGAAALGAPSRARGRHSGRRPRQRCARRH
jgi:hypothetical protein